MDGAGLQEQSVSGAMRRDEHALRNHLTELSVSLAIMRRAAADGDCGAVLVVLPDAEQAAEACRRLMLGTT